jgi:hypothetical protein
MVVSFSNTHPVHFRKECKGSPYSVASHTLEYFLSTLVLPLLLQHCLTVSKLSYLCLVVSTPINNIFSILIPVIYYYYYYPISSPELCCLYKKYSSFNFVFLCKHLSLLSHSWYKKSKKMRNFFCLGNYVCILFFIKIFSVK